MWTQFLVWGTNLVTDVRREDKGQALVEYGLLVALIAVVVVGSVVLLGDDVKKAFDDIVAKI